MTDFYAGGALGFDTLAAQAVLKARRFHPQIRLILALPCRNQDVRWKEADRLLYASIMQRADEVIYLSERYTRGCLFERNRYLIDHCDICICYCKSGEGGTAYKEPQSRHAHAGRSAAKIQKQSVKAACGNPHPLPPLPGRQLRL